MDDVNHPAHYNQGKFEVIEIIEDKDLGFHLGNAIKYILRAGKKDPDKHIEDLEKARWYLNREIERVRAQKENRETVKPNNMEKTDGKKEFQSVDGGLTGVVFCTKPNCPCCIHHAETVARMRRYT